MFAQFETTVEIPGLKEGYCLAEIDARITVKGDPDGTDEYGQLVWDWVIVGLEGYAHNGIPSNSEYQEIEAGSYLHTILTAQIEKGNIEEQAYEALTDALNDAKHAAE